VVVRRITVEADTRREERRIARNRRFAVALSLLLWFMGAVVLVVVAVPGVRRLPVQEWALDLLFPSAIVLFACIFVALSLRKWRTPWGVLGLTLLLIGASLPSVIAVIGPVLNIAPWSVFGALVFWVGVAIFVVYDAAQTKWSQFLLSVAAAWTAAALVCEIGLLPTRPFAAQVLHDWRTLNLLLDVRLGLGGLFVALTVATAVIRSLSTKMPARPEIPTRHMEPVQHRILGPILAPLISVANGVAHIAIWLINTFIAVVIVLGFYLVMTGVRFGELVLEMINKGDGILAMLRALLALAATFAIVLLSFELAPDLRSYLLADTWQPSQVLLVVTTITVIMLCSTVLVVVVDTICVNTRRLLFSISLLVILLVLCAVPLYVLARLAPDTVEGFHIVGPLETIALLVMSAGLVGVLLARLGRRLLRKREPAV
jgi:hypothetical protein